MTTRLPLDWSWEVEALPPQGVEFETVADARQREAVAAYLGIVAVDALRVAWTITPWRKSGVRIGGELAADVTQTCGVTLEPVPEHVSERIEVRLIAEDELHRSRRTPSLEHDFAPDERDPPEPFDGRHLDLGAIALEHLALGLDPYPRAPGAEFAGYDTAAAEPSQPDRQGREPDSPFAALTRMTGSSGDETDG